MTDLTKSSKQQVIDLINNDNSTSLTEENISLGSPVALVDDASGRNTSLLVSAVQFGGYTGSVTVMYDRMDIGGLAGLASTDFPMGGEDTPTLEDVIDAVNARFGTNIEIGVDVPSDIVVPEPDNDGEFVVITTLPGSYAWIGELTVNIALPQIPLEDVITTLILDGLELPEEL